MECDCRPLTLSALDRQLASVPLDDPVVDAQPEAGAPHPLGCKEWLQHPTLDLRRHSGARVRHGTMHPIAGSPCLDQKPATVWQRVHRIQNEVHEHLSVRGSVCGNPRNLASFKADFNPDAVYFRFTVPTRPGEFECFLGQLIEIDWG